MAKTTGRKKAPGKAAGTACEWDSVDLAPIIFIKAAEPLFAERAMTRLRAMARSRDPHTERIVIDCASYRRGQLAQMVSPSLFGEAKFVELPDMENMGDDLLDDLLKYAEAPDPDTWMVLRRNKGVRGKKLVDKLASMKMPTVECPELKYAKQKMALVMNDARAAARRIDTEAAQALVDAMPTATELASALAQLIADTDGTITIDTVNTYHAGRIEANGFQVADAVIAGRTGQALALARHAYETGVDPVVIVSALAIKMRHICLADAASHLGGAQAVGMSPWQLKNARQDAYAWSEAGKALAISAIAEADAQVKGQSRDPQYAVERAIVRICDARRRKS